MSITNPYLLHLTKSDDLTTPYEATRAGFVALALERNHRATPFIEQARTLKVLASEAKNPNDLKNISGIKRALLTASGVSDKASGHMLDENKIEAIQGLIDNFLEPAGSNFIEELVFRFLLTRGDTLGGSMRNVGGVLAERKLSRVIIATLRLRGISYYWLNKSSDSWVEANEDTDIELFLKGLSWSTNGRPRTFIYNLTVPFLGNKGKNVDFCLFDGSWEDFSDTKKKNRSHPNLYIALGELKGGIDPAGADEHWKTANTALSRIRTAFSEQNHSPHLFFIGAAIEADMAIEMWDQLNNGLLSNAANLTNSDQVTSICNWICNL